jgi:O-antigen ligase
MTFDPKRWDYYFLLLFAFTAVASIALQNFVWVSVAAFLFYAFKSGKKIDWPRGIFPVATLVFVLSFFVGAALGVNPVKSAMTVHKYLTILLLFPLGAMALKPKELRTLLETFLYGAVICAIFGIGKHFILHQDRIDSFSGDKMVFGGMLMVSLLFLLYFLDQRPREPRWWVFLPILGMALVFTQTRGAWIGLAVGFVLLALKFNPRWLVAGGVLCIGLFFLFPRDLQDRVETLWKPNIQMGENGQVVSSRDERAFIWTAGLHIIQDHPLGIGQGNLEDIYPSYRSPNAREMTEPHLHDNYLQVTAQNGWFGLAAYLFWIFSFYRSTFGFKTKSAEDDKLNWTFLCAFTAILAWGLTEYTFSHQFMNVQAFLLGLQVCLWKSAKRTSR